ncbi:MAG: hypothetical protein Q9190_006026 [Brigantiaea leucoxantha]
MSSSASVSSSWQSSLNSTASILTQKGSSRRRQAASILSTSKSSSKASLTRRKSTLITYSQRRSMRTKDDVSRPTKPQTGRNQSADLSQGYSEERSLIANKSPEEKKTTPRRSERPSGKDTISVPPPDLQAHTAQRTPNPYFHPWRINKYRSKKNKIVQSFVRKPEPHTSATGSGKANHAAEPPFMDGRNRRPFMNRKRPSTPSPSSQPLSQADSPNSNISTDDSEGQDYHSSLSESNELTLETYGFFKEAWHPDSDDSYTAAISCRGKDDLELCPAMNTAPWPFPLLPFPPITFDASRNLTMAPEFEDSEIAEHEDSACWNEDGDKWMNEFVDWESG